MLALSPAWLPRPASPTSTDGSNGAYAGLPSYEDSCGTGRDTGGTPLNGLHLGGRTGDKPTSNDLKTASGPGSWNRGLTEVVAGVGFEPTTFGL